jgi:peptidoglycan/xylan/chitin deacetylase (PgdA/CDA1 family)
MLRKKRVIIILCFAVVIFVFSSCARSLYMAPVLMYHSINPKSDKVMYRLIVSPESFAKQMRFLKSHHYNVVSLETIGQMIADKRRVPFKTIAITFDDGFGDNYTYAYPVLKKLAIPATIFLIYDEVGRPQNDRLNWDQIKEMQGSGLITFGSHTFGATPLVDINSEVELRRQIIDSKRMFEEKLKTPINTFCYVGGMFTAHIKDLVKEAGYKYAVSTALGKKFSNQDIYAIKRVRISENSRNLFNFWVKLCGYYNSFRNHEK